MGAGKRVIQSVTDQVFQEGGPGDVIAQEKSAKAKMELKKRGRGSLLSGNELGITQQPLSKTLG